MKAAQFDAIAVLISSREPTKSAARRVLVDGISQAEAAREFSISPQTVNRTVRRFNDADELIQTAYSVKRKTA